MRQKKPFLSRLAGDTAGNTIALVAAAMIPFTLIVGSGLDLAVAYMARGKLQNACDAGVLAARQKMEGTTFNQDIEDEFDRFFNFNFPVGSSRAQNVVKTVVQDPDNRSQLLGTASADVDTSLMRIAGFSSLPIAVNCDATRDMGHNDIVMVLDVTGSMNDAPSNGGGTKIGRLRTGAKGLYKALKSDDGSVTRFGIVPYSHTVNVANSLSNNDILRDQEYVKRDRVCNSRDCWYEYGTKTVDPKHSHWAKSTTSESLTTYRTSGDGCIEERTSAGNAASPVRIKSSVVLADINNRSTGSSDTSLQFGRYDPWVQESQSQDGCPSDAVRLKTYDTEADFNTAISNATARVTGGTYHDVGMLWGARFVSRDGFFKGTDLTAGDNVKEIAGFPVNQHIVFMTDGMLDTGSSLYSAHGIESRQGRTQGSGSQDAKHLARFKSICNVTKSMGVTIWVIALDVTDTDDVKECATSADHFYTSDGSDLESVFEEIGRGIGNLRLTR